MPRYLVHSREYGMVFTEDDVESPQQAAEIAAPHFPFTNGTTLNLDVFEVVPEPVAEVTITRTFEVGERVDEDDALPRQIH